MKKLFAVLWPKRDDMPHRWNPNATEDYIRQAKAVGVSSISIGVLVAILLMRLPFGDILAILWAILVFLVSMFALMCARRAQGVLREIDEAIAPEVRMLQRLSPATRDIVMAHLPPIRHPDEDSTENDEPTPPGPPELKLLD